MQTHKEALYDDVKDSVIAVEKMLPVKGLWEAFSKTDVAMDFLSNHDPLCGHSAKVEHNIWVVLSCCKAIETIPAEKWTPWGSFYWENEN